MMHIRRLRPALILLAAPLLLMACGSTSGPPANFYRPTGTSGAPTVTATPAPHYRIGEQVRVGDTWIVTITNATVSSGDSVSTPQTGNEYLIVDVTQQNASSQAASINGTAAWTLEDSTGQQYMLITTDYGEPPTGDVQAGDSQTGQLVYEVPLSEHDFTQTFAPDGGSVQAIWDIQV